MKFVAEFVERAKEAEARAAMTEDETLKLHWRDIGIAYRNLAQARLILIGGGTASEWASSSQDSPPSLQN